MMRHEVLSTLRDLISGRLPSPPPAWRVDEGGDGGLHLSVDGARFDIDVRSVDGESEPVDDVLGFMNQEERDTLANDLDEAADEAEREGPVPAKDLRRSLDEAIERGHEEWESRHRAAE